MSDTGIRIRPARLLDAEGIAGVHVASWQETYRGIMPQRFLDARTVKDRTALWDLSLSQLSPGQVVLVAEAPEDGIVGFVSGGPARDTDFGPGAEIYALYVLKRYQGRGLGRALFDECRAALRQEGMERLTLLVLRANPSRGFYLKMGGTPVGRGEVVRGGQLLAEDRFLWE
jgi:ribosomal protein S18 acetylase RimI-like enzyme